jgi:hypothetical protein
MEPLTWNYAVRVTTKGNLFWKYQMARNLGSSSTTLRKCLVFAHDHNFDADCPSPLPTSYLLLFQRHAYHEPATFRPRLLLVGEQGQGQTTYLAPAVLQHLEGIPVHTLDLPALHSNTAVAAEEALAQVCHSLSCALAIKYFIS